MVLGLFVEGGIDDLHVGAFDGLPDIRDFFGTFVDQQHDQVDLRVIVLDRSGDVLDQGRLTCFGR